MEAARQDRRARFAEFELDLDAGELRRRGVPVPIPHQPLRLLEVLVEHAGGIVSREQLRDRLWPADTFVDFEHGLNAAVKRLRDTLGDSADRPRFVETVPKRGYRFVAPVEGLAPPTAETARPSRARAWILAGTTALAVILSVLAGWRLLRPAPAPEGPSTLRRVTFDPGLQTDPTISPDGTLIAYASNQSGNFDIWVRPISGGDPFPLTNDSADDTQPDWSPDGKWIAFRSERTWTHAGVRSTGGLFRVSVADRRVERISPNGFAPRISPDGARLVFGSSTVASSTYYLAAADGSGVEAIQGAPSVTASVELTAVGWHPRGRLVFLHRNRHRRLRLSSLAYGARTFEEHDVAAGIEARFAELELEVADREPLAWSADGRTLYFVGDSRAVRSLWRMSVDPVSLTIVDGPRIVTTGAWDGGPVALPGGGVAYASSTSARQVWLLRLDPSGRALAEAPTVATPPEWNVSQPALSPDGREMAIQVVPVGGSQRELRVVTLENGASRRVRVLSNNESVFMTHWSPDGRRLLYGYRFGPPGDRRSSIRLLDLTSLEESNVTSDAPYTAADNPWGWSRDLASVLANGSRYVEGRFALVRLPLAAAPMAETRAAVLVTSADRGLWNASESPDGRWVCYNSTDLRGMRESTLYVVPASGGTPRSLTSAGEWDDYPRWSSDGRFVYFVSRRGGRFGLWGIGFDTERGVAASAPFEIAPFTSAQGSIDVRELGWSTLSVAGSRVAVPLQYRTGGIWVLQ